MIRFADVTPEAKPKKAAPPPAPRTPETEAAAPKPAKAPRKKKSG